MKPLSALSLAVTLACAASITPQVRAAGPPPPPAQKVTPPAHHPITGVVQAVMAERSALLVKHDEIPGVMRAMTMMFQVEPAVLTGVATGDRIQAQLFRTEDGKWWLSDVTVIAPKTSS